jgi:glycosyltransferase involved in cell wall biosynthesis
LENQYKTLMIAPDLYPPVGAESIVTLKFACALMENGVDIHVVHYLNKNTKGLKEQIELFQRIIPKAKSISVPKNALKLHDKVQIMIWVWRTIVYSSKFINKNSTSYLLTRIMPIYGHLPGLVLKWLHQITWIANWSDPAPINLGPTPYGQGIHGKSFWGKQFCKLVVKYADHHTFPNHYLAEYMQSIYPGLKGKFSIIPHIAYEGIKPGIKNRKPEVFTLCHIGGLGIRTPKLFLEAILKFHVNNPTIKFKVTFAGHREPLIDDFINQNEMSEFIVQLGRVNYMNSLKLISSSDVSVLIEAPLEIGIFFPSKVLDFIQCDKPILAISPRKGYMSDLLKDETGGIAVDNSDKELILNAIERLYLLWRDNELNDKFSSKQLLKTFNQNKVYSLFLDTLNQIEKVNIISEVCN